MTEVRGATHGIRLVVLVAVALAALVTATPAAAQNISNAEVEDLLAKAKLGSSRVGISVLDVQTGRALVSLRASESFIPASNMKLLTSGAAVAVLGPDFEFRTTLSRSGNRLIVEGAGDPGFADPEILDEMAEELRRLGNAASAGGAVAVRDVESFMDWIADSVARQWAELGPGRITEIVVDDRVLDREYVHPRWPADQLGRWYCAEVGGLNFFANVMRVFVSPTGSSGEFTVRAEPRADWLPIEQRLRPAKKGESTAVDLFRVGTNNSFVLRGAVRTALVEPVEVTTHESSLIFARLLAEELASRGMGEGGRTPTWRLAEPGEDLGAGQLRPLVTVRTPLRKVLERCNGDSHNLYAEALIKRIGREMTGQPGSWANGAAVVRMQLRDRVGPEAAASVTVSDGSGLSRDNLITPSVMTAWLAALSRDRRIAPTFISSVPLAQQEGNMVRRFRGRRLANEVRCKSGYINGVRTLSGYVIHPRTKRTVTFSILVNDVPANVPGSRVKDFHEDVVVLIDQWLTAQTSTADAGAARGN